MTAGRDAANLVPVTSDSSDVPESRGKAIKRRRLRHGIKSLREFADRSGVSRDGVTAAERDEASTETYERLEAWLDRFDEEVGEDGIAPAPMSGEIEIRATGLYGVAEIAVRGPVGNLHEMEAMIDRLIHRATAETDQ